MAEYTITKYIPHETVEAVQWNKLGDIPEVRPYTEIDDGIVCAKCGNIAPLGIITILDTEVIVYPSNWLITNRVRDEYIISNTYFITNYKLYS